MQSGNYMQHNEIVLGTRGSKLALTQSQWVADEITKMTGYSVVLRTIVTKGDRIQNKALPEVGGKGLFTAELEEGLRNGTIDIAVHSLKDLPTENPEDLCIGAIPIREDPRDALVGIPEPKTVGTGSLRRHKQVQNIFSGRNVEVKGIRGNVDTRLKKRDDGIYDSIILAMAGLSRLGIQRDDIHPFSVHQMVPAAGQGALGIQAREHDAKILSILSHIHHNDTALCVQGERRVLEQIGGGCHTPIGCHIRKKEENIFEGFLFTGHICVEHTASTPELIAEYFILHHA